MSELWYDSRTATREQMKTVFQQYRQRIATELVQIADDLSSCNQQRWPENPIEFEYDFTDDVADHVLQEMLRANV